jgi:hypothetical protein
MPHLPEDRLYFEGRIEHELSLAKSAAHPQAARAHSLLAGLYLERLSGETEPAVPDRVQA